jgi:hypothetical protein
MDHQEMRLYQSLVVGEAEGKSTVTSVALGAVADSGAAAVAAAATLAAQVEAGALTAAKSTVAAQVVTTVGQINLTLLVRLVTAQLQLKDYKKTKEKIDAN